MQVQGGQIRSYVSTAVATKMLGISVYKVALKINYFGLTFFKYITLEMPSVL